MVEIEKTKINKMFMKKRKERRVWKNPIKQFKYLLPQRSVEEHYITNRDELAIKNKKRMAYIT
jgi:hypothetical protein